MDSFKLDTGKPKMINCAGCGEEVSNKAASCPKCGNPIKAKSSPVAIGCLTLLMLFGVCTALPDSDSSTSSIASSRAEVKISKAKPVKISNLTFGELDRIYAIKSKVTDLQKDEYWKAYKGQRVQWTGEVRDIRNAMFGTGLRLSIRMKPNTFISDLSISLRDDQKSKALKISQGDTITFTGTLDRWGALTPITLDDGVIN